MTRTFLRAASVFRDILIAAMAVLLTVTFMEAALETRDTRFGGGFSVHDLERNWALLPDARLWFNDEGAQNFVTINHEGYRDTNRALTAPAHMVRVAVLGDSLTTGFQVASEQIYPRVAEREFNALAKGPDHAEFLNFGVHGYSLAQELLTLRKDVLKYKPQIVLLEINQCWAVYRSTPKTQWVLKVSYPNYEYEDGKLVPDQLTRHHPVEPQGIDPEWQLWLNRFQVYGLYCAFRFKVQQFFDKRNGAYLPLLQHDFDAASPPDYSDLVEAWHVSEGLLLLIRDEVQRAGASLVLVIADLPQLTTPSIEERRQFVARLKNSDGTYAEKRFAAFAKANGILAIVLSDDLRRHADLTGSSMHTSLAGGHWNALGHRVVGETIAHAMLALPPRLAIKSRSRRRFIQQDR